MKTIDNGTLTIKNVGDIVTLHGWVQKKRDLGGVVFIGLKYMFDNNPDIRMKCATRKNKRKCNRS